MFDVNRLKTRILSKTKVLQSWKPGEPTQAECEHLKIIRSTLAMLKPGGTERDVVRVLAEALEFPGGMANRIISSDRGDLRVAPWNLPEWFVKRILSWQGETDPTPELIQTLGQGTSFHIYDVISEEELMRLPVAQRLYFDEFAPWLELVVQHEDCGGSRTTRTLTFFYTIDTAKPERIARDKSLLCWLHKDILSVLGRVNWPLLDSSGPGDRNDPIGVDSSGGIAVASAEGLRSLARWMPVSQRVAGEKWANPTIERNLIALKNVTLSDGQPVALECHIGEIRAWSTSLAEPKGNSLACSLGQALVASLGNTHCATPLGYAGDQVKINSNNVLVAGLTDRLSGVAADLGRVNTEQAEATQLMGLASVWLDVVRRLDTSCSNLKLGSLVGRDKLNPISEVERLVSSAYGIKARSFVGTTGTSGLNAAAVASLAQTGEEVIVARDCHISIYHGLAMSGAKPRYINPIYNNEWELNLPITIEQVKDVLERCHDIKALILTSPTYQGFVGKLKAVIEYCHERNVKVMVDGAHGAHLHFLDTFPVSGEDVGADVVTQSTHKVLGALSQGSVVHFNNPELASEFLRWERAFQSTSHSYPILWSIEDAVRRMIGGGEHNWAEARKMAEQLRSRLSKIEGIDVLANDIWADEGIHHDPTRIAVSLRNAALDARELERRLQLQFGIVSEMVGRHTILFLIGPGTTEFDVRRIAKAFQAIIDVAERRIFAGPICTVNIPELAYTPREALLSRSVESVRLEDADGAICAETLALYPPGQPLIVAGEKVNSEVMKVLQVYREGLRKHSMVIRIAGASSPTLETVRILR